MKFHSRTSRKVLYLFYMKCVKETSEIVQIDELV